MSIIAKSQPGLWTRGTAGARSLVGPAVGVLLLTLFAIFVGVFAAFMPASVTVRLAILLVGGLVVLLALSLSPGAAVAGRLMRRLLFLWVVVAVVWPHYLAYHGLPGPAINPIRLTFWLLVGVWFFWLIGSRSLRAQLASRMSQSLPFFAMLTAYLVWSLICALFSAVPFLSISQLIRTMAGPVLMLLITMSCLRDRRDVDLVLFLVVLAAILAVGVGLVEAVKQRNLFFDIVPSLFPQGGEGEAAWAEQLIRDKSRDGNYRVMSTFVHPLTFGEFLALAFSIAIYLFGYVPQFVRRVTGLFALPLLIAGIYITHTRSILLALGVVVVGLIGTLGMRAIRQRNSPGASIAGFFILVSVPVAVLALGAVALEFSAGRSAAEVGSTAARLTMLKYGGQLMFEQPLVGYGPGFAAVTLGILPGFTALTIDNYYLSVALESGLPGLLAMLGLLAYPTARGLTQSVRYPGRDGARLAVIAVSLAGYAVVKLVLSQPDNLAMVFLFIGLLSISIEQARVATPQATVQRPGSVWFNRLAARPRGF